MASSLRRTRSIRCLRQRTVRPLSLVPKTRIFFRFTKASSMAGLGTSYTKLQGSTKLLRPEEVCVSVRCRKYQFCFSQFSKTVDTQSWIEGCRTSFSKIIYTQDQYKPFHYVDNRKAFQLNPWPELVLQDKTCKLILHKRPWTVPEIACFPNDGLLIVQSAPFIRSSSFPGSNASINRGSARRLTPS